MNEPDHVSPSLIRRFLQLPRPSREVWQGGIVAMPTWIKSGPDEEPVRPWAAVWVSLTSGQIHLEMEHDLGQHGLDLGLAAFLQFGLKRYKGLDGRPATIQVADPELGAYIAAETGDRELAVEVVPELAAIGHVLRMFAEDTIGGPLPPGPLTGEGVTVDRMRAFADAAAAWWKAEPWQFLTDEDAIRVESPAPPQSLGWVTVLGNAGISYGMHVGTERLDADRLAAAAAGEASHGRLPFWALFFGPIDELPIDDADMWLAEELPVAARQAYPWLARQGDGPTVERPDRTVLSFVEGVLRALAKTTEQEIDSGRWTRRVGTADGAMEITLALPALLGKEGDGGSDRMAPLDRRAMERIFVEMERYRRVHPPDTPAGADAMIDEFVKRRERGERPAAGQSPAERAQDLVFDAFETAGRRRVVLAKQALALDPNCADAYVILAEHAAGPARALPFFEQAVEAGRRALGPGTFDRESGRFWDLIETRPYMRSVAGLADSLVGLGRPGEAVGHYRELLRLNPNDSQGIRYRLLRTLLELGRDEEAASLGELYPDDMLAEWAYGKALLTFRREGDTPAARRVLQSAIKANRHVPRVLVNEEPPRGGLPPLFEPGSEDEAESCAHDLHSLWHGTPGAVAWLKRVAAAIRSARSSKTAGRAGTRRQKR